MSVLSAAPKRPASRLLIALSGIILVAAGALLIVRPLTALLVLAGASAVALFLCAVRTLVQARSPLARAMSVLIALAAAAIILWLPECISALPELAAVLLILLAAFRVWRLARGPRQALTLRYASLAWALSAVVAAVLCVVWPDVATLAVATAWSAALILLGLRLLWVAVRPNSRPRVWRLRTVQVIASTLAVLLVGTGAVLSVRLLSGTASVDGFYAWSGSLAQPAGTVVKVGSYSGEVPEGATALRILYVTSHADGTPALASAVLAYPNGPAEADGRPVLAWQHGTTGVARSCGPSVGADALTEYAVPGISRAIERGWVVVATDYPGQGTAGRYPYLIGEGEGRATLDAVRAARSLAETHASARTWIWGHSQGGHASLWAGELQPTYAPELDLLGVAALSAASDPLAMAQRVTAAGAGALSQVVTSLVLVPYTQEYADVTLRDTVHPAGHRIIKTFAGRCVIETPVIVSVLVASALGADVPLTTIDLTGGTTSERLTQNIASGIVPAPLFQGQGVDDEVVPIQMQRDLAAKLCSEGRTVSTHEYAGRSHMGVIAEGSPLIDDLFTWADEVAAGAHPSTC